MEINDLIIFKTVAEEGTISGAAEKLGYVQPNVTERIKKLEQELEAPLLHRHNKGVSLLPSGEVLLEYANNILTLVEEAKQEIKQGEQPFRIATSQSILSHYLTPRIKDRYQNYQIFMENSSQLQELLKKKKVDLVITYAAFHHPSFQKVHSTTVSMGLLKGKESTNVDFSKEAFFVSHDLQCPFRNQTMEFIKEHHLSTKQLQQVDSFQLIKEFVAEGKGLAFLPVSSEPLHIIEEVEIHNIPVYFYMNRGANREVPEELL
jgi:DNA-binding transcriptional LysR family regulator